MVDRDTVTNIKLASCERLPSFRLNPPQYHFAPAIRRAKFPAVKMVLSTTPFRNPKGSLVVTAILRPKLRTDILIQTCCPPLYKRADTSTIELLGQADACWYGIWKRWRLYYHSTTTIQQRSPQGHTSPLPKSLQINAASHQCPRPKTIYDQDINKTKHQTSPKNQSMIRPSIPRIQ